MEGILLLYIFYLKTNLFYSLETFQLSLYLSIYLLFLSERFCIHRYFRDIWKGFFYLQITSQRSSIKEDAIEGEIVPTSCQKLHEVIGGFSDQISK